MSQINNPPMMTELVDVPITPTGGAKIDTHPQTLQNRRLLGVGALIAKFALWMIESESNNVGSAIVPKDSKNAQTFKITLDRMWKRVIKYNKSAAGILEFTHPIRFPTLEELQGMANTPFQQLNYLLWDGFQILLGQQGTKLQTFVDSTAIDEFSEWMLELVEFIDVEIGDGTKSGQDDGKFNVGAGMPNLGRLGVISPTPVHGNVSVAEPSSETPPSMPPDSPDR